MTRMRLLVLVLGLAACGGTPSEETDQTIYESRQWADPTPAVFPDRVLKIDAGQTFRIECSFANATAAEQRFPDQMCVGGMYLLSCALPFAC